MLVLSYIRRGRRRLEHLMLDPRLKTAGAAVAYGGSGFLLSAASLGNAPLPLAMGLICAATGWRALVLSLGAMLGYPSFWGSGGMPGIVWSAVGGLLALMVGKREESREQPLMIPAIAAFLTAATALAFRLILEDTTPIWIHGLRTALAFGSGVLFTQAARCRDSIVDWLVGAVAVLALAQVGFLGYLAAGVMAVGCAFPAAALAGLGLDLAQITPLPMTAVMCLAFFIRQIPFGKKWQHYAAPGFAGIAVMAACGLWDTTPLPWLFLGGGLAVFLPPQPPITRRRGETGVAQVRLELGAQMLQDVKDLLCAAHPPEIDREALLRRACAQSCTACPDRKGCVQRETLTVSHLENPLDADCKRQGRLVPELTRAKAQLKLLTADHKRQEEYREALVQQYAFLSDYLRHLADCLPRRGEVVQPQFAIEASARSRGKEKANGDRCLAFTGPECCYYVLLCDGMGTGVGAAREGNTAGKLLKQMLTAGFPPEHALGSLNSLLALRGCAGAVTVDLAQIRLDTGIACIYKWGAAPSWVLSRNGVEKIGTATAPPGLSVKASRETVHKLSLRRGEVLILLSDGADGEVLRRFDLSPDKPPGELAAMILEKGCEKAEDDTTAAVLRLRSLIPVTS